jgi:DGQHR domain-containing protein
MSKVAKLDMYNMEKPHEVESIVKNKRQKELQLENFLTIDALKGKQFGHEIYVTVLRFKEVQTFLETFQDVQRQIMPHKVASIKRYILTGLKKNPAMRFFPSLTVTARGHLFFEESSNRLAIDVRKSKLSINDGQHRYTSCVAAINELKEKIARSKDEEDKFILRSELKELEEMVLPITIFNNLSESEEKQLFYDTNSLAQRPSRSTTIRLAQTDYGVS